MSSAKPHPLKPHPLKHHFNKLNFIKSFVATAHSQKAKEEERKRAAIIADAIEETQSEVEKLVKKQGFEGFKRGSILKYPLTKLAIALTIIMSSLFVLLSIIRIFIENAFNL